MVVVSVPLLLHKLEILLHYEKNAILRSGVAVEDVKFALEKIWSSLRVQEESLTDRDLVTLGEGELVKTLMDSEDDIDNFIGETELQRRNDSIKINWVPLFCLRPQLHPVVPIVLNQNQIRTVLALAEVHTKLDAKLPTDSLRQSRRQRLRPPLLPRHLDDQQAPDDLDFVDLNNEVHEVVKQLCDGEIPNTIAVIGEAGSGKTFLTKTIYNATDVKRHFHGRAWVNYSEKFEAREFLLNILTQLTWDWECLDENLSQDELKLKLQNFSSEKRCLIVIDGVWLLEDFVKLSDVCGLVSKGIWLIVTICSQDVAHASLEVEVQSWLRHLISLQSLTNEESWALFCKKARITEDIFAEDNEYFYNQEGLINLKENALRKWGGSPRSILILEGLLSTTKLPRVIEPEVIELDVQEDILNLCYEELSSRMKVCFLYFGLFPRAFEIPVRRLLHLWHGEGLLITLPEENTAPEDLAEECLKLLIRRNLIEVTKLKLDGSPKTCRMPITTWDVFSRSAVALGLFHVHNDTTSPKSNIRRLADYADNGIHPSFYSIQSLRSYVSFNTGIRESSTKETSKFLDALVSRRGFGLLVVLDLENVYKPMLSEIGKLLHLKYLGLRRTFLDSLPSSVGNLPLLVTLDVKHTNITTLPSSIWKAKNLQHLYLNENNFDTSFKNIYNRSGIILQTLSGLFIGNKSVVRSYLHTILHLRKLKLTFYSKSAGGLADWISKLKTLRSLKLRSIDEFDRPSTLELGSLQTHHELLELYLLGHLPRTIDECPFPPNLKVLTLSASKLKQDPMPMLGKLCHLNCLKLFRNSYVGERMTCHAGEFLELRILKLWMLEDLEEWDVNEGALPHLRELEIRGCNKLKQPEGLLLLNTLKDVVLINMPGEFVANVERDLVNAFVKGITLPIAALPVSLLSLSLFNWHFAFESNCTFHPSSFKQLNAFECRSNMLGLLPVR